MVKARNSEELCPMALTHPMILATEEEDVAVDAAEAEANNGTTRPVDHHPHSNPAPLKRHSNHRSVNYRGP